MAMVEMLEFDGSYGEGGGQIVRSSLALSMVTGRAVRIDRIRAGRSRPGLGRQHLAAARAAMQIGGASMVGDELGSRWLQFEPRPVVGGNYSFAIETAGSATLVLQTVLPALLIAKEPSTLMLAGGTHNPWAPPFEFLQRVYSPLIERMGPRVSLELDQYGFYPAGGGRFRAQIEPCRLLSGFDLLERGRFVSHTIEVLIANLPPHIAERELQTLLGELAWETRCGQIKQVASSGPGNAVMIEVVHEHVRALFTALGRKGVPAERVAREVVAEVHDYLRREVPVESHLADQLVLPLAISAWQHAANDPHGGGSFRTGPLSMHTQTQMEVVRRFLELPIEVTGSAEEAVVRIRRAV